MQHGDVWRALDAIATRKGLTPSGLARLAGLDATAFNKSKRISKEGRPRWPSTESIARALNAASVDYVEFAALVSNRIGTLIPFAAFPAAADDDKFTISGIPEVSAWDQVQFPGQDWDNGCFALEIINADLEPIYRRGDRLIASRQAHIRNLDRVIVKTVEGALQVGALVRQTVGGLELMTLPDAGSVVTLETDQIDWLARIIWASQ